MKRIYYIIGGLLLILFLSSSYPCGNSIERMDNQNTCNYNNKTLDGQLYAFTYKGENNFVVIVINILKIQNNPKCEPKITGTIIEIPNDKISKFNEIIDPEGSKNAFMSNGDMKNNISNLLKKNPNLIKKFLESCNDFTTRKLE